MAKSDAERARSVARKLETRGQNTRIGAALAQTLDESGLTQARLAELLGVARGDVERWVRGDYNVPALLAFDERLPQTFRERLQAKWAVPPKAPLVRDERAVLVTVLEASSALAKHLLATSSPANDNAGPPPVRAIAQAHDILADYLRARAA